MSWQESDEKELQEYYDKLMIKDNKLAKQLEYIRVIINNTKKIQSRKVTPFNENKELIITIIKPKDKWGDEMTDEYKIIVKNECITKANELEEESVE